MWCGWKVVLAAAFGDHRHRQFGDDQQHEDRHEQARRHDKGEQPTQLHDRHADRVPQRGLSPGRVRRGGPQPLGHHGQPHDHVTDDDDQVVAVVEQPRDPGGHHQRPGDLHQDRQPVGHVVVVVGRGEPGEVHPGPPDGEEHHQVARQCRCRHGSRRRSGPGSAAPGRPQRRNTGRTTIPAAWRPGDVRRADGPASGRTRARLFDHRSARSSPTALTAIGRSTLTERTA